MKLLIDLHAAMSSSLAWAVLVRMQQSSLLARVLVE
jgi:hypothetical protein